jgi:hypothetical protein
VKNPYDLAPCQPTLGQQLSAINSRINNRSNNNSFPSSHTPSSISLASFPQPPPMSLPYPQLPEISPLPPALMDTQHNTHHVPIDSAAGLYDPSSDEINNNNTSSHTTSTTSTSSNGNHSTTDSHSHTTGNDNNASESSFASSEQLLASKSPVLPRGKPVARQLYL